MEVSVAWERPSSRTCSELGNNPPVIWGDGAKGSGRTKASLAFGDGHQASTISGKGKTGEQVFFSEIGEVIENLGVGHPGSHVAEDIVSGNSQAANAGLAPELARFDRENFSIVHRHESKLPKQCRRVNRCLAALTQSFVWSEDGSMISRVLAILVILKCVLGIAAEGRRVETVAGTGKAGFSGDGGLAVKAELNQPYGLVVGPGGALFVCDMGNDRIRKIETNGIISTVAGSGVKGWSGDGGVATAAALNEPYEVRFDRAGNMFFVEMRNNLVRRVDGKTGMISTVAGQGKAGFAGDGGPAVKALFNQPHSIQFVGEDELWVCDIGNHRLRAIDLKTGLIRTVGGTGEKVETRDGELLLGNPLKGPRAIDVGVDGTIWLALREGNAIYRIDGGTRKIARVAGTGAQGFGGNGGAALAATLSGPKGISAAGNGAVVWADTESHSIRYLDAKKGTVELLVGTGKKGDGSDGDALQCKLSRPHGIYAQRDGTIYIGDSENHRVRKTHF